MNPNCSDFNPRLIFLLSISLLSSASQPPQPSPAISQYAACQPSGPTKALTPLLSFLERVQEAALASLPPSAFDAKYYVDIPLKYSLHETVSAFDSLPRSQGGVIARHDLYAFLRDYFYEAGSDLVPFRPDDFVTEPEGFLPLVRHPEVRAWALEVHSLWTNLSRKVDVGVVEANPKRHTLLPLPGHFIIPGSRFREVYYWDSYWVIRGLLTSKMYNTAKSIVRNLIFLIEEYGFVLNGARSYYTNRSEPPLLSSMVVEIYMRTGDRTFLKESLPALLKEHHFWNSGVHKVTIHDVNGHKHSLSRYYAMWDKPRPESGTIDVHLASTLSNVCKKEKLYRQVASTAESGWDFSSRWMRNSSDLRTLATTSILPVDLNAYLLKMELDIAYSAKFIGDNLTSEKFLIAAKARRKAIQSIFWNPDMGQWFDYWLQKETTQEEAHQWKVENQNKKVVVSNFVPVWLEPYFSTDGITLDCIVKSLQSSGLIHDAGIATTLVNSGQQWDFPNGWPPMQHMIVEGLSNFGSKEARHIAEDIAIKWIKTNYATYRKTGAMSEKYDVRECGKIGGGGEYKPQTGFGWSNGVVLALLEEFGWPEDREIDC